MSGHIHADRGQAMRSRAHFQFSAVSKTQANPFCSPEAGAQFHVWQVFRIAGRTGRCSSLNSTQSQWLVQWSAASRACQRIPAVSLCSSTRVTAEYASQLLCCSLRGFRHRCLFVAAGGGGFGPRRRLVGILGLRLLSRQRQLWRAAFGRRPSFKRRPLAVFAEACVFWPAQLSVARSVASFPFL